MSSGELRCVTRSIDANLIYLFLYIVLAQTTSLSVSDPPPHSNSTPGSCLTSYLDTLSPDTTAEIPTFTDNLFSQGTIPEHLVSISFEPLTEDDQENGEITWGMRNYYLKPQPEC